MAKYEVVVGNIGNVHSGRNKSEAIVCYYEYVSQSKSHVGRAADESVYLMEDGEVIEEHQGPADDEMYHHEVDEPSCPDKLVEELLSLCEELLAAYSETMHNATTGRRKRYQEISARVADIRDGDLV